MNTQVGVIEFPVPEIPLPTEGMLQYLLDYGLRGRIVGWGIWKEMNLALRDIGSRGAEVLSQELPFEWRGFTIQQSGKVRWSIKRGNQGVVIWDLQNWVKRKPKEGETARALYYAIRSAGRKMGVKPRGYFGNGNLASPILRVNGVSIPDTSKIEEKIKSAFFGGRIQSIRIGKHIGPVYEYDLNSAYAWGLSQLPDLNGATIEEGGGMRASSTSLWRLVEVEWDIPRQKAPIYPFPVRGKGGKVEYPRAGQGIYWSPQVNLSQKLWPREVRAIRSWTIHPENDSKPFSFVHDLYRVRQSITNPLEANIVKWTLAALWGKLCQRPTGRPERFNYRCMAWAGMTTSLVNAELLRVAMTNPSAVWSFAVDSIISDTDLDIGNKLSDNSLGAWKRSRYLEIEAYQPGFWRMKRPDGTWKQKSRGVPEGAFDWEEAAKEWKKYGSYGRVAVSWEEFVGLSSLADSSAPWLTSTLIEMAVFLRPGGLKSSRDLERAGAGRTRIWEPPDRTEDAKDFDLECGIDHDASFERELI